eukprot:c835_g1_i1.p1 GENE.c835_g1_i1~~c835_g1_i1.p1  ORF type:complete len:301 (+),score=47.06 c835_g1_i1:35-904(+)
MGRTRSRRTPASDKSPEEFPISKPNPHTIPPSETNTNQKSQKNQPSNAAFGADFHRTAKSWIFQFALASHNFELAQAVADDINQSEIESSPQQALIMMIWKDACADVDNRVKDPGKWLSLFVRAIPMPALSLEPDSEFMLLVQNLIRHALLIHIEENSIEWSQHIEHYLPSAHAQHVSQMNVTIEQHNLGTSLLSPSKLQIMQQSLHWHKVFSRMRLSLNDVHRQVGLCGRGDAHASKRQDLIRAYVNRHQFLHDTMVQCCHFLSRHLPPQPSFLLEQAQLAVDFDAQT